MVFNSILNLMQDDYEGVYKFLCRIFYENYDDLSLEECQIIFSAIESVRVLDSITFDDFIGCFDKSGRIFKVLNELRPNGLYGIFTSEKNVQVEELEGVPLILISDFFDIFTKEVGLKNETSYESKVGILQESLGFSEIR